MSSSQANEVKLMLTTISTRLVRIEILGDSDCHDHHERASSLNDGNWAAYARGMLRGAKATAPSEWAAYDAAIAGQRYAEDQLAGGRDPDAVLDIMLETPALPQNPRSPNRCRIYDAQTNEQLADTGEAA